MTSKLKADTQTITVRVSKDAKEQAEIILEDIGLTFTGLINACIKAVVREKRVPFNLISSDEYELQKEIRVKLEESEMMANDPTARRYTHEEIFTPLRKKYRYDI